MEVRPIAGSLGAKVRGIDLSCDLSNAETVTIRDAWLAHKVLVFDGPILEPERQLSAARLFGEPDLYLLIKGLDGFPEVIETLKTE